MNIERHDSTVIFQIVQETVVILRIVYRGFLTADINGRAGLVLGRRHNRLELTAVTQSSLRVAHAGIMQWKDVDRPTFTQICNSAINWLDPWRSQECELGEGAPFPCPLPRPLPLLPFPLPPLPLLTGFRGYNPRKFF